jgi:uncharacterized protein with HEPN domain
MIPEEYGAVDIERIWDIVANHVPPLRRAIEAMLSASEQDKG